MSQGQTQLGLNLHGGVVRLASQVIEALHYHEHVVYTNPQTQEWEGGVHGGVGEPEDRGQADRDDEAHEDTNDTSDGNVESDLHSIDLAEHSDGVEEHCEVSDENEIDIEEDRLRADVTEAADRVRQELDLAGAHVEGDLEELPLPVDGGHVGRVDLQPSLGDELHSVRHFERPDHVGRLGGDDVSRGVPGDPAQEMLVLRGVAVPGASLQ